MPKAHRLKQLTEEADIVSEGGILKGTRTAIMEEGRKRRPGGARIASERRQIKGSFEDMSTTKGNRTTRRKDEI